MRFCSYKGGGKHPRADSSPFPTAECGIEQTRSKPDGHCEGESDGWEKMSRKEAWAPGAESIRERVTTHRGNPPFLMHAAGDVFSK